MDTCTEQLKETLRALTPEQRFDIAWADEGEVVHGVLATPEALAIAYWQDCDT
jgi:hypothetical protein